MVDEATEYLISQYADGSLPQSQRAAVEARVAQDADARQMLAQYRSLDAMLASAPGLPTMQWDKLAARISAHVDAVAVPATSMKIADYSRATPAELAKRNPYKMAWYRRPASWAVAASLFIAGGVAIELVPHHHANVPAVQHAIPQTSNDQVANVSGPQAQTGTGPSVAEVNVLNPAANDPNHNGSKVAAGAPNANPHVAVLDNNSPDNQKKDGAH